MAANLHAAVLMLGNCGSRETFMRVYSFVRAVSDDAGFVVIKHHIQHSYLSLTDVIASPVAVGVVAEDEVSEETTLRQVVHHPN